VRAKIAAMRILNHSTAGLAAKNRGD
jgi:hypothetical protein